MGGVFSQRRAMRTSFLLMALLVTVFCLQQTNGLFFYLREGQTKCFLEDLPKDTVVIVQVDASDIREGAIIAGDTKNDIYRRKAQKPRQLALLDRSLPVRRWLSNRPSPPRAALPLPPKHPASTASVCVPTAPTGSVLDLFAWMSTSKWVMPTPTITRRSRLWSNSPIWRCSFAD